MSDPYRRSTASERRIARRQRQAQRDMLNAHGVGSGLSLLSSVMDMALDGDDPYHALADYAYEEYGPGRRIARPFQVPESLYMPEAILPLSSNPATIEATPFAQNNIMPKGRSAVSKLVNRSAMKVTGKVKQKKTKRVKINPKLRKAVKQIVASEAGFGTYSTVKCGFVGTITAAAAGKLDGDDLNTTEPQVYYNASGNAPGRTLFNQLCFWVSGATTNVVPGTGLNFFTPGKIIDAASVLFNNKTPAQNPYNVTGNLSTYNPTGANPGKLKIDVINSYVRFTIKNVSARTINMDIWECTPVIMFQGSNALADCVAVHAAYSATGTASNNWKYSANADTFTPSAALAIYDPHVDPLGVAKNVMGWKFTWKKRSMVLAPAETCTHSIQGPKGVLDMTKVNRTYLTGDEPLTFLSQSILMKGFGVSCIISITGDQATPFTTTTAGGRHTYATGVLTVLGAPVAVEIEEAYKIRVPEVAGFITANGAAGTSQQLNLRKRQDIFYNQTAKGNPSYIINNEENPAAGSGAATTLSAQYA